MFYNKRMRRLFSMHEFGSVLKLAVPISILQTGMVLYGTVATLFVGRIGPEAIACVGLAGSSYVLLFIVALGILLGIDPLSSQAFGAGRRHDCVEVFLHAILLALAAVLPFFWLLSEAGRAFSLVGIEPAIAQTTASYLKILRWALFPGVLFAACRQFLQTQNVTRPQILAVALGNSLNVLLCYCLVLGGLGVASLGALGAAYSMLAANCLMFSVAAIAAVLEIRGIGFRWKGINPAILRELLRVGIPAGMQMLAEVGAFSLATMLCGRLGAAAAASHQIALNLASLSFMVPLGVSHAASVRVGQGIGSRRPESAARSGTAAFAIGIAFMSLSSLAYLCMPRVLLGFYTTDSQVIRLGTQLLGVAAFFQIFDGIQVVATGALRGLGQTRVPMLANAVGYWLIGLPAGAVLAFRFNWGVLGIWLGLCLGLCLVAMSLLFVWRDQASALRAEAGRSGPLLL